MGLLGAKFSTTGRKVLDLCAFVAGLTFVAPGAGAGPTAIHLASFGHGLAPVFGDAVAPTVGAAQMCSDDPAERFCRGVARYEAIVLDERVAELLVTVNRAANNDITPVDDIELWGVAERWNRPVAGADGRLRDDCDGYVIEKWYRLVVEKGLPAEAFYPLYADVPGYGGHLVLAVNTTQGTFILDNLRDDLVALDEFSFTFLKRPRPGDRLDGTWERFIVIS